MELKVKTFRYERVEVTSSTLVVPEAPAYYFQTGIRRAVRIVPVWTTWNKEQYDKEEEIWKLRVTCAYRSGESRAEVFEVQVARLEDLLNADKDPYNVARLLYGSGSGEERTKEQFDADLAAVLEARPTSTSGKYPMRDIQGYDDFVNEKSELDGWEIEQVDVDAIRPGDTVVRDGRLQTVTKQDIKTGGFEGTTLFGDSYGGGRKKVQRATHKAEADRRARAARK